MNRYDFLTTEDPKWPTFHGHFEGDKFWRPGDGLLSTLGRLKSGEWVFYWDRNVMEKKHWLIGDVSEEEFNKTWTKHE